ncbi:MAG: hypothetical protein LUD17_05175 [Bacteroidales bacterium]|nr:hypothetical protein [Bacteroidales bacterium]
MATTHKEYDAQTADEPMTADELTEKGKLGWVREETIVYYVGGDAKFHYIFSKDVEDD